MKSPIPRGFELYRQRTTLEYNLSQPSVPLFLCFTFKLFYGKFIIPDCSYPDYILGDWFSWIPCRRHYPYSFSNSCDCYHLEVNQKRLMALRMSLVVYLELGFLLNAQIWPLCRVGTSSPSNFPQGFSSGTLSKMILRTPMKGMDKNIPEIPHTAPPSNTTIIEISALIFTFEDTI